MIVFFFRRNAWKILTLSIYRFLAKSQWFILKSNDYNYTFFKLPLREPATSWSLPRSQHHQLPRWEIFLSYFTFSFKIVLLQGMDLIMRRTSDVRRVIKIKKGQFKDCSRRRCLRGIITRNYNILASCCYEVCRYVKCPVLLYSRVNGNIYEIKWNSGRVPIHTFLKKGPANRALVKSDASGSDTSAESEQVRIQGVQQSFPDKLEYIADME